MKFTSPAPRAIFAGTPPIALPALRALFASDFRVVGALTRQDAPAGRKHRLSPSAVAGAAKELGLRVIRANRPIEALDEIGSLRPDLGVIVAYGGLIPKKLLNLPKYGWINLHFSDLPRYRGASPVQRSLLAGDRQTALSIFCLKEQLDAGDILAQMPWDYNPLATAGQILEDMAEKSAPWLVEVARKWTAQTLQPRPQKGAISLAPKLLAGEGRIQWSGSSQEVFNRFRSCTPEPGAYTGLGQQRVKLIKLLPLQAEAPAGSEPGWVFRQNRQVGVVCGRGALELVALQVAGKKSLEALAWLRGLREQARFC